jgi:hypothetical protein
MFWAYPHNSAPRSEFWRAIPHRQKSFSAAFRSCGLQWLFCVTVQQPPSNDRMTPLQSTFLNGLENDAFIRAATEPNDMKHARRQWAH